MNRLKLWAKQMKNQLTVLYFATKHPDMPIYLKLLSLFIISYALSPIDLIPDFIPVLGILDDLILLPLGIYICYKLIPPHIITAAESHVNDDVESKHTIAIICLILVFWLLVIIGTFRIISQK